MYEKYWGATITTEAQDASEGASDPSQPALILRSLYEPATIGLGICLIAGLPLIAEACERGAYPFTDDCAPLADLPKAIKTIVSTSTDVASAAMIADRPGLSFTASAPSSSGYLIFDSQIIKPISI